MKSCAGLAGGEFDEMEGGFEFDFSGLGNCEGSKLPGFISVQNSGSGFQ